MISYILYFIFFGVAIPFSMVQSLSFGYEDNFMRFSDLDMVSYYDETNTVNDYFGDSKSQRFGVAMWHEAVCAR